ncbi:MAG: cytochrome c oxidase assembly protein [Actinobacteria bacterium]|nr:cytochrome c oxidase assembly protein [Actinomycetota bacterium]
MSVDVSPAPQPTDTTPRPAFGILGALGAVLLASTAIGLLIGGGAYTAPAPGIVDSGPFVGWVLPLLRASALAAGIATFGWLGYAAFLGPQQRGGLLGTGALADVKRAGTAAGVWTVAALAAALFSLANVLGTPLSEAIRPAVIGQYAWAIPGVRAYLMAALFAGLIWVGSRYARSLAAAAGWFVLALAALSFAPLAGHAAGYGDHDLALTSGVAHTWAAAAWAGGLLALALHAWRHDPGVTQAAARYSNIALISVAFLALTGVGNAYTRMDTVSDLWNSGYGRLVFTKTIILVVLVGLAAVVRRNLAPKLGEQRRVLAGFVGMELLLLAVAGGLAVALAQTPYPRAENSPLTVAEQLLGRQMPEAPTWSSLILGWEFEPLFLIGGVISAALYVAGVMRLRARGDSWHPGRTISWLLGVAAIIWVTNSGMAVYSQVAFSIHMFQHMLLSMIAPILLVMGTPITLALRAINPAPAGRRGPREWIVWAINSPVAKFVTHPLWVLFVFTFGLYGLYYTSLFGWLMGSHMGHLAMQIHFLLAGYLFAYVILGLDPAPRVLAPWVRLLMLLVAMALHSFFAVPIMMSDIVFAGEWYSLVQPPWVDSLVSETRTAGGIAWGIAEVPALMLMIVLGIQWARSSDREARRYDRQADRDGGAELAAYNERLRAMNEAASNRGE